MSRFFLSCMIITLFSCFLISCTGNITDYQDFRSAQWPQSTPEEQGLSSEMLERAFAQAVHRPFINGICIIRNGYLVAEMYYNGYDKNDSHNIRSVAKSFLSALIGIAIREGYITDLQVRILEILPEYSTIINDNRFTWITIGDLLTMRSGIDTDQNNYQIIFSSEDWLRTAFSQSLIADPGTEFHYTTAGTHILSALLTRATGMTSFEFAEKYLLQPLEINLSTWQRGPRGVYFGGNNMHTSPRDMAKLGYLYLNAGASGENQIVPADWVTESLKDRLRRDTMNWGPLSDMGYGYLWWLGRIKGHMSFIAIGHGGQFILAIPELQLIIATVSYSYNLTWEEADVQERAVLQLIADYILPAVAD